MSFTFSDKEREEIDAMLNGESDQQEQSTQQVETSARETQTNETVSPKVEQQVTQQASESPQTQGKPEEKPDPDKNIRPVPYSRFAEVNNKARQAENELTQLRAREAELTAKLEAFERNPPKRDANLPKWLSDVLDDEELNDNATTQTQIHADHELQSEMAQLKSTVAEIQAERQQLMLERHVANVLKEYPDLPETILLSGLAAGKPVEEIVNAYDYVGQQYVEKRGYVRKEQQVQQESSKVDVAPRLTAARGKVNAPEPQTYVAGWGKAHKQRVDEEFKMLR